MTRRMLDSRLWANEHFGEMPMMARLLLLGIINHADDQGRIKGKLMYLRTEIFRYDRDVTDEQVGECLKLIEANGTIECYAADGKEYVQLLNWWDYQSLQFAAPSDMPRSATWQDRIRYNAKGGATLTCNWVTPKGEKPIDTCDQDGNPLPIVATLPPRNPGGRPPQNPQEKPPVNGRENPSGNPNKEEIKINIKQEGDHARDPYTVQPKPGEYLPGISLPRQRQAKCNADHMARQRDKLGLSPPQLTSLTDTVLARMNATEIAALDTNMGNDELRLAQEATLALAGLGHRTPEAINVIFDTFDTHDWRGLKGESPTYKSIVGHARDMPKKVAGRTKQASTLSEAERNVLITRAKNARSAKRTAEQLGGRIDPQWDKDIEAAKGLS